ncbi:MAG TPA: nicotinate-nucleotide adenylyltransferase [Tissierellales bacterium]|nr:nicotinate-nucleotide adenylyltransferase [Tissierellales bacterium]
MSRDKIGIMGGTFDPIHIGHLIIAEEAREFLNLEEVIFIPTGKPPHKKSSGITSSLHRYNMTELGIKSNSNFSISAIEVENSSTTYTIDTIEKLRKTYKNTQFFFIIGGDSIINIHKWKDYKDLLKSCNFLVAKRAGSPDEEVKNIINKLNRIYGKVIYEVPIPYIDISSTEIRSKVMKNKSIKYYVPMDVEEYIKNKNLYKG